MIQIRRTGLLLFLTIVLAGVSANVAAATPSTVLRGTNAPDVLTGTATAEWIQGLGGDDVIDGHGGGDYVDPGYGRDTVTIYAGDELNAVSWPHDRGDTDTIICVGRPKFLRADAWDVMRGDCAPYAKPLIRTDRPFQLVYDFGVHARVLRDGDGTLAGLGVSENAVQQMPTRSVFPAEQLVGKVRRDQIRRLSARQLADLLVARMGKREFLAGGAQSELVGFDELGADLRDSGDGPKLLAAMRILAARKHPVTGEPLSRRVILYAAPSMVASVGTGRGAGDWDAALAACRLSGGVFLEMYHGLGRNLRAASREEFRTYPAGWNRAMGSQTGRLHFLFTGRGAAQGKQWAWAASTPAGRRILAAGAGAYRLGSRANTIAWLRAWHRYTPGQTPATVPEA